MPSVRVSDRSEYWAMPAVWVASGAVPKKTFPADSSSAAPWHPVVLRTGHGTYLLIGKQTRSEDYIRRVDVHVDVPDGD